MRQVHELGGDPGVVVGFQLQVRERIAAMCIETGADQYQLWPESVQARQQPRAPQVAERSRARTWRQGAVDAVARVRGVGIAGAWIQRHLVAGREQHAWLAGAEFLRAIAVVHVEIGDGDALQPVCGQRVGGAQGHVVEQAEAHRLCRRGVVARWAYCAKGMVAGPRHDRIDRGDDGASRAQGRFRGVCTPIGIGVQHVRTFVGRPGQDGVDVLGAMHAQQLPAAGARRLDTVHGRIAVGVQRPQHGLQPRGTLGMIARRRVSQAGTVGVQLQHALAQEAGFGLGRRWCCQRTSPKPLARASTLDITNSRSDKRFR